MIPELARAVELRTSGKPRESLELLLGLARERPEDPLVHYHCAWSHDVLGLEREAIPFYERAVELGLSGADLEGALIGLGSSYRCLGRTAEAERTLRRACREFPESRAAQAFLAMALYNAGAHAEAMELLLRSLGESSADESIRRYRRAILGYAGNLEPEAS